MENFVMTQTNQNEDFKVVQQWASLSAPPGTFLKHPEPNPKGHLSVVTLRSGKQLEDTSKKDNNESEENEKI